MANGAKFGGGAHGVCVIRWINIQRASEAYKKTLALFKKSTKILEIAK